jgi:hypothetical protein
MSVCGTWPIGWPGPVNTGTTRPLNGKLQAFGYPQARQLLYHERVRQRLDGTCAEAQKESGIRYSFASEKSALLHVCDLDDGKKIPQPHR